MILLFIIYMLVKFKIKIFKYNFKNSRVRVKVNLYQCVVYLRTVVLSNVLFKWFSLEEISNMIYIFKSSRISISYVASRDVSKLCCCM